MFSCILFVTSGDSSDIFTNAAPCALDQDQIGGRLPWKCLAASISWLSVMHVGTIMYRDKLQVDSSFPYDIIQDTGEPSYRTQHLPTTELEVHVNGRQSPEFPKLLVTHSSLQLVVPVRDVAK